MERESMCKQNHRSRSHSHHGLELRRFLWLVTRRLGIAAVVGGGLEILLRILHGVDGTLQCRQPTVAIRRVGTRQLERLGHTTVARGDTDVLVLALGTCHQRHSNTSM